LPYYLEAPVSTYEQSGETMPILLAQFHPEQQKEKQVSETCLSLNYYQYVISLVKETNALRAGCMYTSVGHFISKKYSTIL
jgi:hypothetical protein